MDSVIANLLDAIDRLRREGGDAVQPAADRAREQAIALLHAAVDSVERARWMQQSKRSNLSPEDLR
jgi:hypothetical protein